VDSAGGDFEILGTATVVDMAVEPQPQPQAQRRGDQSNRQREKREQGRGHNSPHSSHRDRTRGTWCVLFPCELEVRFLAQAAACPYTPPADPIRII
jgi:hypothetical protein